VEGPTKGAPADWRWQEVLGWTYSFQGRLEEATKECLRAIEIDPDFGNPYNDIGVYLMQQDKLDEAIPWLERAKRARRYEPRQFPYMNLGRVYLKKRRWWDALREFEGAVRLQSFSAKTVVATRSARRSAVPASPSRKARASSAAQAENLRRAPISWNASV
jgi:Tfp pilus assembly protein PilF